MKKDYEKNLLSTQAALCSLMCTLSEKIDEGGDVSTDYLQNIKNRISDIVNGKFDPNAPFGWDFSEYMRKELFDGFLEYPLTTSAATVREYLTEYYDYLDRAGISSSALRCPPKDITGKKKLLEILRKQGIYTYGELLTEVLNREGMLTDISGVGQHNVIEIKQMYRRILGSEFLEDLKIKRWKLEK